MRWIVCAFATLIALSGCEATNLYPTDPTPRQCLCDGWFGLPPDEDGLATLYCWSNAAGRYAGMCTVEECQKCFSIVTCESE